MRKLNLVALNGDKDALLNVLRRTGAAEIKERKEEEGLTPVEVDGGEIRSYLSSLETALEIVENAAAQSPEKGERHPYKDGFEVSFAEFSAAGALKDECESLVAKINSLADKKSACNAEEARLLRELSICEPYKILREKFSEFSDTARVKVRLGLVPSSAFDGVKKRLDELSLAFCEGMPSGENTVIFAYFMGDVAAEAENILAEAGFAPCPYCENKTGEEKYAEISEDIEGVRARRAEAEKGLIALAQKTRALKIYCDFVAFELEKREESGKAMRTESAIFFEAFVPAPAEEKVKAALEESKLAIYYDFFDPAEDEQVPTLLQNNPVVKNFETITNMYSPPSAREFDPNAVMALFYSLFLGFIMGDVGYGLLMILGGGFIYFKSRKPSGVKSLAGVFATGGIFAVIWGILFNSLFGKSFLPFNIMPVVIDESYNFDRFTILGIELPAILVIALYIGILQIFAGYICRAVQEWRRGNIFDGICDGVSWALFSLGVGIAVAGMIEEFALPSALTIAGGIIAGASLLFAVVTAGRKERLIGKFTKGFGSLYGVINYISDILSYARLYGLMLSGAVIAQIVSKYAIQFIETSIPFAIIGVILMIVGHLFNFAMGLLGAYIHDARLQYVEFYGRFYEGEGELFVPLGSRTRHISVAGD